MIAIPNMDKSTNCIDCIAHRSYDHDEYFWHGSNYCKALGKYFNKDKLDIDPFKQILPDCPLIEIDETDTELLEFFNEFKKWENCKEVAKYIRAIYGERRTDETNSRLLDDM